MRDDNDRYNGRDGDYDWNIFWWSVAGIAIVIIGVGICYVTSFLNR